MKLNDVYCSFVVGAISIVSFIVVFELTWSVPPISRVLVGVGVLIPTLPLFNIVIFKFVPLFPIPKFEVPTEYTFYPKLQLVPVVSFDS